MSGTYEQARVERAVRIVRANERTDLPSGPFKRRLSVPTSIDTRPKWEMEKKGNAKERKGKWEEGNGPMSQALKHGSHDMGKPKFWSCISASGLVFWPRFGLLGLRKI